MADLADQHSGLMVGFFLPPGIASKLQLPGGEPVEDLHLTLAYLGDLVELRLNAAANAVDVARTFAAQHAPLTVRISSFGTFPPTADRPTTVLYADVEGPDLQAFRADLVAALSLAGLEPAGMQATSGYIPHITLAYLEPNWMASLPEISTLEPITFAELTVAAGDHRICFPLEGDPGPDLRLTADVRKIDEALGQVFGWANIAVTKSGKEIVDLHGEEIDVKELEKAAYDFVLHFADVGLNDLHAGPLVAKLLESIVFTHEKLAALAIDPATGEVNDEAFEALKKYVAQGWWTGWQMDPAGAEFASVRSGERPMLSIEGWATKEVA